MPWEQWGKEDQEFSVLLGYIVSSRPCLKNKIKQATEKILWLEARVVKPDDVNLIPGIHIMEEKRMDS